MNFDFSLEKNEILIRERGVSFYQIIESIADKGILLDFPHPNTGKYPNQRILIVECNKYTYCVPYVINNEIFFLKTIFPSRKFMNLLPGDK